MLMQTDSRIQPAKCCMKRHASIAIVLLGASLAGVTPASAESGTSEPDASQLRTGRFSYRTLVQDKDWGTSEISVREGSALGTFIYSNHVTGQFSQEWEAIASADFAPVSAKLSFGDGGALHPV